VITRSVAVVEAGGVLRTVSSRPPLTIRQVYSAQPDVCSLCLVGSAAGPLSGDEVVLDLTVLDGARANLISAGAAIAQGMPGCPPGRVLSAVSVGADAQLFAEPAPLIVSAGSSVEVMISLELAETALVRWRELVVLGRSGERGGAVRLDWSVRRSGRPVLIQSIDLTDAALVRWPGMLGQRRVISSALITGPGVIAATMIDAPTAMCQKIDDHTALITVLDVDAASAEHRLNELLPDCG
jgi:urease accessory protein